MIFFFPATVIIQLFLHAHDLLQFHRFTNLLPKMHLISSFNNFLPEIINLKNEIIILRCFPFSSFEIGRIL